jgi:glycosyltransferase involved in cell wall biosynthesis
MDYHFGFTDITSCLAADRVFFNSHTHLSQFFDHLQPFIQKMPELRPRWVEAEIRRKSGVLCPGISLRTPEDPLSSPRHPRPLIVWNHRWEFDKDPGAFFEALGELDEAGVDFELALLGENFQIVPKPFIAARERYGARILRWGYEEDRARYERWLLEGWICVSTAVQENFGISVAEAAALGCVPLVPRRLSYPELLPEPLHADCLYSDRDDLLQRLHGLLREPERMLPLRQEAVRGMRRFAWSRRATAVDDAIEELANRAQP